MSDLYTVKEIFGPTLQGEGTHAGMVCKFLRLAGCNAKCFFCDTDWVDGHDLTADEIILKLNALGPVRTVVVTGGEPTLQLDLTLVSALHQAGYSIHLETNGTLALGDLIDQIDHITLSPKQSRAHTLLERADTLKIVYPSFDPHVTPEAFSDYPANDHYLQPIHSPQYESNLKKTLLFLYENPRWKLSLQTHKIIGIK